jgi:Flp pilus assembly protein TadD
MASGGISEAASLLTRRAPTVSEDVEYHEILAAAQLASEDYEGARISYSSLVQQDRSKGNWWYGYAASSDFLGNRSVAAQAYNRAIQSFDLSPSLRRRSEERLAQLSQ